MGRGSVRKFIEKNGKEDGNSQGARTFKLVPRSLADESDTTADRVFIEITPGAARRELDSLADAFIDVLQYSEGESDAVFPSHEFKSQVGEAARYGVLYDDRQYDYTKHLKSVGQPGGVLVNSYKEPSINESDYMQQIKELDEAVYQDIKTVVDDPAVLEVFMALEDEAFVDNTIEDDFVIEMDALSECSEDSSSICIVDEYSSGNADSNGDTDSELNKILEEFSEDDADVMPDVVLSASDKQKIRAAIIQEERKRGFAEVDELRRALLTDCPVRVTSDLSEFDSDEYFQSSESETEPHLPSCTTKTRVSCHQIIEISRKTGMPIAKSASACELQDQQQHAASRDNLGTARNKQETAEERRLRKAAVKSSRQERRSEKKENRRLFSAAI